MFDRTYTPEYLTIAALLVSVSFLLGMIFYERVLLEPPPSTGHFGGVQIRQVTQ